MYLSKFNPHNAIRFHKSLLNPFKLKTNFYFKRNIIVSSSKFIYNNFRSYSKSEDISTQSVSDTEVDSFCDSLDHDKQNWWSLYVRGEVPDYPPRRSMFNKLTSEGIDVECMETYEIEDFTRWLLMREVHGPNYPKFPYDITLEQKIEELKQRIPLKHQND